MYLFNCFLSSRPWVIPYSGTVLYGTVYYMLTPETWEYTHTGMWTTLMKSCNAVLVTLQEECRIWSESAVSLEFQRWIHIICRLLNFLKAKLLSGTFKKNVILITYISNFRFLHVFISSASLYWHQSMIPVLQYIF